MTDFPTTISAVSAAIETYSFEPNWETETDEAAAKLEADAAAFAEKQFNRAPVVRVTTAFRSLRDYVDQLDEAGLMILGGCAHVIADNGLGQQSGLPPMAFETRDRVRDRLLSGVP